LQGAGRQTMQEPVDEPTAIDQQQQWGLLVSASSLLIMFVLQPLAKNAIAASRSICAVLWAVIRWLLAPDEDSGGIVDAEDVVGDHQGTAPAPRHCEQCARRGASLSDVAAVVASLGLVVGDDAFFAGGADLTGSSQASCGGCAAMAVVDDLLTESKVASEAELREAFYVFDRDEDGFVTPDELWNVMRRLGMLGGIEYGDCRRMVAAHDGDGDGRISFREFRAMMEGAA
jgi:hypothetical protein